MSKIYRFDTYKYVNAFQKEITYFLSVAEVLNISKAAELLGVQQPGLSRAIHRLEQELGLKLFQRKNFGLLLTPHGERFYVAVKNTKQKWEECFNILLNESEHPSGLIKIGLHSSFGQAYLPRIIQKLSQTFTQIEIEVNTLPSFQVTRKIIENELDFGIVISEIKNPEIIQKNIGSDFLATYQSNLQQVPTHFLINPETQMSNQILKKQRLFKKIYIKDYELLAKTAVELDCGIALLPQSVAKNYSNLKQVSGSLVKAQISLICHKEKLKSRANKKIYDELLAACKSHGPKVL